MGKINPLEDFLYLHYRYVHGIRVALSFVICMVLFKSVHLPDSSWALTTLVVVMGPMSYLGNVRIRAMQRMLGTVIGAVSGLIGLYIGRYSIPLMLIWCLFIAFLCGYFALGKQPYAGLLIGVTLSVVISSSVADINVPLWRCADVIVGSLLAVFFTSIYPQRAFIYWRIKMSQSLDMLHLMYSAYLSSNLIDCPDLSKHRQKVISNLVIIRSLISPAANETKINKLCLSDSQELFRNIVAMVELIKQSHWDHRDGHFLMLMMPDLRALQKHNIKMMHALAGAMISGNMEPLEDDAQRLHGMAQQFQEQFKPTYLPADQALSVTSHIWLNIEVAKKLSLLVQNITMMMKKSKKNGVFSRRLVLNKKPSQITEGKAKQFH